MPTLTAPQILGVLMLVVLIIGPICLLIKTSGMKHGFQLLGIIFALSIAGAVITTVAFNLIGLK